MSKNVRNFLTFVDENVTFLLFFNKSNTWFIFVYISKDEENAWLAAYHEMMNNSGELGKSLGYPGYCVEYFTKNY